MYNTNVTNELFFVKLFRKRGETNDYSRLRQSERRRAKYAENRLKQLLFSFVSGNIT